MCDMPGQLLSLSNSNFLTYKMGMIVSTQSYLQIALEAIVNGHIHHYLVRAGWAFRK